MNTIVLNFNDGCGEPDLRIIKTSLSELELKKEITTVLGGMDGDWGYDTIIDELESKGLIEVIPHDETYEYNI